MMCAYQLIMPPERSVHPLAELLRVLIKHAGAIFKAKTLRTISPAVGYVTGCLVAQQVDVNIMLKEVTEKVDDIAHIGDGTRLFFLLHAQRSLNDLLQRVAFQADPSLIEAGFYPGRVHLSNDGYSSRDFSGLALRPAHAAQA